MFPSFLKSFSQSNQSEWLTVLRSSTNYLTFQSEWLTELRSSTNFLTNLVCLFLLSFWSLFVLLPLTFWQQFAILPS